MTNLSRRRVLRGAVAAGGLAAGVSATTSSGTFIAEARAQGARRTFVTVSGAFCGAWCWDRVSDRLEKQGHRVYSISLTGLADRSHLLSKDINLDTHIKDIVNFVEWEDLTDICLIAHSYGGFPAAGALEHIGSRVSSVVLVDAFKPADGQSLAPNRAALKVDDDAISLPPPKALPPNAWHDPKDAAWYISKMTPHPIGTFLQPVKLSGAREKVAKKTFIRLPMFKLAPLDKAYEECKADKSWTALENTTSGHAVMVNEPDWLTGVLLKAA